MDGARVGAVELRAAEAQEFAAGKPVALTAGRHTVSVAFTNDAYDPPADRNLRVTAVGFVRSD